MQPFLVLRDKIYGKRLVRNYEYGTFFLKGRFYQLWSIKIEKLIEFHSIDRRHDEVVTILILSTQYRDAKKDRFFEKCLNIQYLNKKQIVLFLFFFNF